MRSPWIQVKGNMPRGGSPVASHRPRGAGTRQHVLPKGSRPTGTLARTSSRVDLSMGEEMWATALAEQAHSRLWVAMHELRVPAPGAEGDQARLNIDVTDR